MFTPYNVLFYLKKRNTYKSGPAPIYLRISVDGQRTEVSVGRECDPSRWNSHAGRATGNKEDVRGLNTFLDSVQSKLNVAHHMLLETGKEITAESLRDLLTGKKPKSKMLLDILRNTMKMWKFFLEMVLSQTP